MTHHSAINWDIDLPPDPEEEYQTLAHALMRNQGFSLMFVQCSPAEGSHIIQRIHQDLPNKIIHLLSFEHPIENGNIYLKVKQFIESIGEVDILFIRGLEYSLYDYEETKRQLGWDVQETHFYSWKGVPSILVNLNQQRERFRDTFNTCFVFLVPHFVIKYLINRAPDFFDWRSGIFELPMDEKQLERATQDNCMEEPKWKNFQVLSSYDRQNRIITIQSLLDEEKLSPIQKVRLLFEQALLFDANQEYELAISRYDLALQLYSSSQDLPDLHEIWSNRGTALFSLGRYEEAIQSYSHALKIEPGKYTLWDSKGIALSKLGRYEEAIESYDMALKLKNDDWETMYNRGVALYMLNRYEEAITAWNSVITINPYASQAHFNIACVYALQEKSSQAIESLRAAIELDPGKYYKKLQEEHDFDMIRSQKDFQKLVTSRNNTFVAS